MTPPLRVPTGKPAATRRRVRGSGGAGVRFDLGALRAGLTGWRLHFISTCRSTSDLAGRMRREGRLFAPAVVLTPRQTAGRGRGDNRWASDPGTLTVTFAIPVDPGHPPHELPLVAGLAVRDAIAELLGPDCQPGSAAAMVQIKWPNDVFVDGRKVAGLLCERIEKVDLVGVGINVCTRLGRLPAPLRERATSLEVQGSGASPGEALLAVARHLHRATRSRAPFTAVLRRYDAHHFLVGRSVSIRVAPGQIVSGVCKGLDSMGRLLVTDATGAGETHRIIAGQVISY